MNLRKDHYRGFARVRCAGRPAVPPIPPLRVPGGPRGGAPGAGRHLPPAPCARGPRGGPRARSGLPAGQRSPLGIWRARLRAAGSTSPPERAAPPPPPRGLLPRAGGPSRLRSPLPPPVPVRGRASPLPPCPPASRSIAAEGCFPPTHPPPGSSHLPRGSRCRHRERARGGREPGGGRRGGCPPAAEGRGRREGRTTAAQGPARVAGGRRRASGTPEWKGLPPGAGERDAARERASPWARAGGRAGGPREPAVRKRGYGPPWHSETCAGPPPGRRRATAPRCRCRRHRTPVWPPARRVPAAARVYPSSPVPHSAPRGRARGSARGRAHGPPEAALARRKPAADSTAAGGGPPPSLPSRLRWCPLPVPIPGSRGPPPPPHGAPAPPGRGEGGGSGPGEGPGRAGGSAREGRRGLATPRRPRERKRRVQRRARRPSGLGRVPRVPTPKLWGADPRRAAAEQPVCRDLRGQVFRDGARGGRRAAAAGPERGRRVEATRGDGSCPSGRPKPRLSSRVQLPPGAGLLRETPGPGRRTRSWRRVSCAPRGRTLRRGAPEPAGGCRVSPPRPVSSPLPRLPPSPRGGGGPVAGGGGGGTPAGISGRFPHPRARYLASALLLPPLGDPPVWSRVPACSSRAPRRARRTGRAFPPPPPAPVLHPPPAAGGGAGRREGEGRGEGLRPPRPPVAAPGRDGHGPRAPGPRVLGWRAGRGFKDSGGPMRLAEAAGCAAGGPGGRRARAPRPPMPAGAPRARPAGSRDGEGVTLPPLSAVWSRRRDAARSA